MWNIDLYNLISELWQSNSSICEDISVVKCENENIQQFKTNKIIIFQNWPFLAENLYDCDLVIIDTPSCKSSNILSSAEKVLPFENPIQLQEQSTRQELQRNICDQCGKSFGTVDKLKRHRKNTHQDLSCQVCGISVGSPGAMKRHKEVHQANPLKCEICGKTISYSSHYNRHLQTHFPQLKYDCSVCHLRFRTTQGLKQHAETHNSESFICKFCSKSFNVKRYLSQHLKLCNMRCA